MGTKDYNRIKEWLDPLLAARGLSIEEFSRQAEISKASIYFYRTDKMRPNESQMAKICGALGKPLEEGLAQYTPKPNGRPKGLGQTVRQLQAR